MIINSGLEQITRVVAIFCKAAFNLEHIPQSAEKSTDVNVDF